jgi:hypothetical protein
MDQQKRIKRIKYVVALGGYQAMTIQTTKNKKHPGAREERRVMRRDQRGARGSVISLFWGQLSWEEVTNKIK